MGQTIRRSGANARKQAAKASSARKVEAARAQTGSLLDWVLDNLPFSEAQLHRFFLLLILAAAAGLLVLVASLAGVPAMAENHVASLATQAGFAVRRVEVHGVKHLNELTVYDRVLGTQGRQAMTRIDLAAIRADLMTLNWVEEARVSRELPDTLVVDIVERQPHAVLKIRGADGSDSFVLIDATGHELEPIAALRTKNRLVMAGEGAELKVAALTALLDAAPALRPQVAEAEWIGHRRWNLTFKTGQTLALPEGEEAAAHALVKFAQYDGTNQLLGGQAAAFDMRLGDRIYARVPNREADAAAAAAAQANGAAAAGAVAASPTPSASASSSTAKVVGAAAVGAGVAVAAAVAHSAEKPVKAAPKPPSAVVGKPLAAVAKVVAKPEVHKAEARKPEAHKPATAPHKAEAHKPEAKKPAAKPAPKPASKPAPKPATKSTAKAKPAPKKTEKH
ncbi:cell division protein FtsQ/DivIB [Novosphingobium umbonatum]|uniref:cell division protein FtsQ/DivIB n=1 Tax=Novosphingobium umbonatum TaxID=1908524 RepID=UPI001C70A524|nr:FtsQ-type POTRA domain-containing protein [Novosphingobium umbonatum]